VSARSETAASLPAANGPAPLVQVDHLVKYFPIKAGLLFDRTVDQVHAVDDVSFKLESGKTLGLVGESGCGKSTLCRTILRLEEPTRGSVTFEGRDITHLRRRALRPLRSDIQMIFQDPYASLNPRKRVGQLIGDPMRLHGIESGAKRRQAIQQLMERVGLSPEHYNRFPHEFSGGQRQRIGIARALALEPQLILADEPVSALDVSIQAQIINLLKDLQAERGLTYVFVAHDLGVVRHVSDRIAVMYLGKVVEVSPAEALYTRPIHPYTVALLSAIPIPDPKENAAREPLVLEGDVPSPINPPPACRFHTRCPRATDVCRRVEPPLVDYGDGHMAACHHPVNVDGQALARARIAAETPLGAGSDMPTLDRGLPDLEEAIPPPSGEPV
jgi:peptide/nickel transport system ATP-binding protein